MAICCAACFVMSGSEAWAADPAQSSVDSSAVEFFEARIRPVLVQHCYECHSADAKTVQGGLLLDSAAALRRGGDSGAAIDADAPLNSLLLSAMRYDGMEMPPSGRLPDHVIQDIESWLRNGAVDPRTAEAGDHAVGNEINIDEGRQFWAFQPPQSADVPDELRGQSMSQRIDFLVRRRLAAEGLTSARAADRRTLIRRLSFDLTGLPPSSQDVDRFVNDADPNATAALVDRLLNSAAFGERWARVWLDVARYAEDQAHIVGSNKALFYPNAWKYREWVINALNSDLPYDQFVTLQLAADLVAADDLQAQVALGFIGLGPKYYRRGDPEVMAEEWEDRVDVVARGLQGLTLACARCHDHKFDPIRTEDYYAVAGVFAGTEMFNRPLDGAEADKNGQAKNPDQSLHVVRDSGPKDLNVLVRGNVKNKGAVVPRGFVQVAFPGERRTFQKGSGRAELAAAIVDRSNPLTARVIVNRIWQQYFGRGIVGTPSNFGQLGEHPTHPHLLDDLAVGLMDHDWSLKWLHRQIVLSETYQQSSDLTAAAEHDPDNRLLWRMPRRRLSVEAWRDAALAVSGRLDQTIGGPSMAADDPAQNRRTIYAEVSRFELNPLLARFDFPDPNTHSARRVETNTPLQKLFLLNSPLILAQADALADAVAYSSGTDGEAERQVVAVFQAALQRVPDADEAAIATAYLQEHPEQGLKQLAQNLLASNEFWWLD
ncbi:MAG: PSD1 and planctomycete cytochrome C domain-containing protein [Planctomycetaceae bacterium]